MRGFLFALQVCLFKDRQGLKFAFRFKLFKVYLEKVWILKKNPEIQSANQVPSGNPDLTPTVECPEMLAEMPEPVKLIEPEDM